MACRSGDFGDRSAVTLGLYHYEPNTLRSEADCLQSGYPIEKSTIVEN